MNDKEQGGLWGGGPVRTPSMIPEQPTADSVLAKARALNAAAHTAPAAPEETGSNPRGLDLITLPKGVRVINTGLVVSRALTFKEYEALARGLQGIHDSWKWWAADLLIYGEKRYGETYAQALEVFGVQYETLANIASVGRKFEISRRRELLSFSHHAAVASLPPEEQDRLFEWCEETVELTGKPRSVSDLRTLVRTHKGAVSDPPAAQEEQDDTPNTEAEETQTDFLTDDLADGNAPEETGSNPHVANNSGEEEWYTPPAYTEAARYTMGAIDLDPASCALANSFVGAETFYTKDEDGLTYPWMGNVWMNPPYSRGLVDKFIAKLVDHYLKGEVSAACVLVNNATETKWFHTLLSAASDICLIQGRVNFIDKDGNPSGEPLQGQVIVYLGSEPDAFKAYFSRFGVICHVA